MPSSRTTNPAPKRTKKAPASPEIAVLSDIHSNLPALQAVLAECEARRITQFVCLGDIVGYGANPAECLKTIRALRCPTVIGNHDFYVGTGTIEANLSEGARVGIEYSREHLGASARKWLRELPDVIVGDGFTIVHSSLEDPLEWHYIISALEARSTLALQETPVCFYGHTHVPRLFVGSQPAPDMLGEGKFQLHRDGITLINFGSVGQPRNEDARAQFGVFNPRDFTVEFVRVEYDREAAARAVLAAGLPEYLGARLLVGL